MNCLNCNNKLSKKQIKYCCKSCKQNSWQIKKRSEYKSKTGLSLQSSKGVLRKIVFINELGGMCGSCGYNKNISALEFHHVNPKTKNFNIDARTISNLSMDKIRIELAKCVLICSNCHRELHNPLLNFENLK